MNEESVSFGRALKVSLFLSGLFLAVYGSCNWVSSQRANVPTLAFGWERQIPFVPWMLLPYMSIDLFFVGAPFLSEDRRELVTFTKRIVAALLIAACCFLLIPHRFVFARPAASGWLGACFDWFRGLDQPYNLIPSLHIAFGTLLADTYARHTRGGLRIALLVWFVVIAASAVFTYQHHVIDVVTGFILGGYCLYFFPIAELPLNRNVNRLIGGYYVAGAMLLGVAASYCWPWGALLLWPLAATVTVAVAYFYTGGSVYRKRHGLIPWTSWFALGPCLLGQRISWFYYRRQCHAWDEVSPNVWIGRVLSEREAARAVSEGVSVVVDLTAEFSAPRAFRSVDYRNVALLDLTAPSSAQLDELAQFIAERAAHGAVYVHCKIGYSRSAGAVGAYLLFSGQARTVEEAISGLRRVRPSLVVRPEIISALSTYAASLNKVLPNKSTCVLAEVENDQAT